MSHFQIASIVFSDIVQPILLVLAKDTDKNPMILSGPFLSSRAHLEVFVGPKETWHSNKTKPSYFLVLAK